MSMWLPFAIFVLLTVGFVLPCLLDIANTPDWEFSTMSKGMWMMVAGVFWVFGAIAWLALGRPHRLFVPRRKVSLGFDPAAAAAIRHPASGHPASGRIGRGPGAWLQGNISRTSGPDDDIEFLLDLDRRIREARDGI
jgi:hypothetical protein